MQNRGSPIRSRVALFALAGTAACASGAEPARNPGSAARAHDVTAFLPKDGDVLCSYDVTSSRSGTGLYWLRFRKPGPNRLDLISSSGTRHLRLSPDRAEDARGGFLLVAPLLESSHWQGRSGNVRVARVDMEMNLESQTLRGCIETVERGRIAGVTSEQTVVFCPGAGIVSIEQEHKGAGGERTHEKAVLRGCDDPNRALVL